MFTGARCICYAACFGSEEFQVNKITGYWKYALTIVGQTGLIVWCRCGGCQSAELYVVT